MSMTRRGFIGVCSVVLGVMMAPIRALRGAKIEIKDPDVALPSGTFVFRPPLCGWRPIPDLTADELLERREGGRPWGRVCGDGTVKPFAYNSVKDSREA